MAEPMYMPEHEEKPERERSIGELLGELSQEVSRLVRQEIRLARVEMTEKARELGKSAGFFGVAALGGLMVISTLTAAAILGLAEVIPGWAAALIVMAAWAVIAGIVGAIGWSTYKQATPPVPEQTIETVKDDIQWAKQQRSGEK
jgi:uncharacterized membrane protein YqjE